MKHSLDYTDVKIEDWVSDYRYWVGRYVTSGEPQHLELAIYSMKNTRKCADDMLAHMERIKK